MYDLLIYDYLITEVDKPSEFENEIRLADDDGQYFMVRLHYLYQRIVVGLVRFRAENSTDSDKLISKCTISISIENRIYFVKLNIYRNREKQNRTLVDSIILMDFHIDSHRIDFEQFRAENSNHNCVQFKNLFYRKDGVLLVLMCLRLKHTNYKDNSRYKKLYYEL